MYPPRGRHVFAASSPATNPQPSSSQEVIRKLLGARDVAWTPLALEIPPFPCFICRAFTSGSRPDSGVSISLPARDQRGVRAGPVGSSEVQEAPQIQGAQVCMFIIGFRSRPLGGIYAEAGSSPGPRCQEAILLWSVFNSWVFALPIKNTRAL